jgi:hypothetical protein
LIEVNPTDKGLARLEPALQLEPAKASANYRLGGGCIGRGCTEDAKREIELYKKLRDMKEKLRDLYKEFQVHPKQAGSEIIFGIGNVPEHWENASKASDVGEME